MIDWSKSLIHNMSYNLAISKMTIEHIATKYFTSGLKKFSNLHKGESCYIFGDGPSIKWFDLSEFSNHPSICCGMMPFHRDFSKLDVRYCTMVEPWLFCPDWLKRKKFLVDLNKIAEEYKTFIKRATDKQFFINLSNRLSLVGENINYVFRGLPEIRNKTDELLNQLNLFAGSFHASLTLAYYLGFSKIFLVGFDAWTIQPARTLRWYELGQGEYFEATNFAAELLNILKSECEIYTISMDGESRNVTNISYEAYTGVKPKFRENYELVEPRMLKILATFPEYKIYEDALNE